jgi:hypothetical protein
VRDDTGWCSFRVRGQAGTRGSVVDADEGELQGVGVLVGERFRALSLGPVQLLLGVIDADADVVVPPVPAVVLVRVGAGRFVHRATVRTVDRCGCSSSARSSSEGQEDREILVGPLRLLLDLVPGDPSAA